MCREVALSFRRTLDELGDAAETGLSEIVQVRRRRPKTSLLIARHTIRHRSWQRANATSGGGVLAHGTSAAHSGTRFASSVRFVGRSRASPIKASMVMPVSSKRRPIAAAAMSKFLYQHMGSPQRRLIYWSARPAITLAPSIGSLRPLTKRVSMTAEANLRLPSQLLLSR